MKAADWTNESTFIKFHHKPEFSANFSEGGGGVGPSASPAKDDDDDR